MPDLDRLAPLKARFDAQPMRGGAPYAEGLRRAGRLGDAVTVIREALRRHPRNVYGLVVLARCLRDQGEAEAAGMAVREALALDPSDPTVRDLASLVACEPSPAPLAPAATDGPAPEEAPPDTTVAEAAVPALFVTETMAELYLRQGLHERAVAIYRALITRTPNDTRLAARLAEILAPTDRADAPPEATAATDAARWSVQDASDPASVSDEPVIADVFDFSEDERRAVELTPAADDAMLAGLSFDAIALTTPGTHAGTLELPTVEGPSAREALRRLVARPVPARPEAAPAPTDPVGDDFDQWLRGVS